MKIRRVYKIEDFNDPLLNEKMNQLTRRYKKILIIRGKKGISFYVPTNDQEENNKIFDVIRRLLGK